VTVTADLEAIRVVIDAHMLGGRMLRITVCTTATRAIHCAPSSLATPPSGVDRPRLLKLVHLSWSVAFDDHCIALRSSGSPINCACAHMLHSIFCNP
jgi:hypothetical protein